MNARGGALASEVWSVEGGGFLPNRIYSRNLFKEECLPLDSHFVPILGPPPGPPPQPPVPVPPSLFKCDIS